MMSVVDVLLTVNEASVVEVDVGLAPRDGGSGTTGDAYEQAEGSAGAQADGLLQVIVELKVGSFCVTSSNVTTSHKTIIFSL